MDKILEGSNQILLVGEGNFSFSSNLQQNLPAGVKVVATCFECSLPSSNGAQENKDNLKKHGATVLYGVDATKLECHSYLSQMKPFDCIIFQFPHVGGKGNIKKNRNLLKNFFVSASKVLSQHGMVLVTLCNGQGGTLKDNPQREWNNSWQVVAMATYGDFILTQTIPFDKVKWHLYQNTGYRGQDKSFNISGAVMHIFHRSQTHPASWAAGERNQRFSRIFDLQKQAYATVMRLCCDGLGEYSMEAIDIKIDNLKDSTSHEYLQLVDEYAAAKTEDNKESDPNIQKLSSNQSEHRKTSNQFSGFVDFIRAINGIHDHCCISSLVQDVSSGRIDSSGVKLVHKNCLISPFSYPIVHYAIVTVPRKESDFKHFQETVVRSIYQQCRTDNDVAEIKTSENSFRWSRLCDLKTQCDDCHRINTDENGEATSVCCRLFEGDGCIVPLSSTFFQRGDKMSAVFCLEHFVMNKFKIEDIRILWSLDETWWEKFSHFLTEYVTNQSVCDIQPLSLYPPSYVHDLSFWESSEKEFDEIVFISVVREVTVDNVRELYLVDTFQLGDRTSRCYRMIYQSCDQALTNHEAGRLQMIVRKCIKEKLDLTPR